MALVSTNDASKRLKVTRVRVTQLINLGLLAAVKVGRDWLIEESELDRFAKLKRSPGRPKKKSK